MVSTTMDFTTMDSQEIMDFTYGQNHFFLILTSFLVPSSAKPTSKEISAGILLRPGREEMARSTGTLNFYKIYHFINALGRSRCRTRRCMARQGDQQKGS